MIEDFDLLEVGDPVPDHVVEFYDWSCLSCFFNDPDHQHRLIYNGHWWDDEMQRWDVELACATCENLWIERIEVDQGQS